MSDVRPSGTDVLVASAGGHLQELLALRGRWRPHSHELWVTYRTPQAISLLDAHDVRFAHHPTTKNLPNAVRNYRLARGLFAERRVDRVISTGAAVAVPFMIRAQRLGIPCHYIESAARAEGPSLSGRMLARSPKTHLYRQLGEWGGRQWHKGPSVFDGFVVARAACAAPRIERVLTSLGTHQFGFQALLERLRRILPSDLETSWQVGSTPTPPGLRGHVFNQLPADELSEQIDRADVIIGHAGVGLTLAALEAGKVPVLVPRRRARREHTDDHQVQLAKALEAMGLAVTAQVGELSYDHLEWAASLRVIRNEPPAFKLIE
jgi:UDP-N-acetylglucosamine--N-acetylmuramyl-(pentapeptide) pyrophosphoryl-undecaprenol N-acetylglucosamine transferase